MSKFFKNIFSNKNFILLIMMNTLYFISNSYLIFSILRLTNIENILRIFIVIIFILSLILSILKTIKVLIRKKNKKAILLSIILLILFIIQCFLYNAIDKIYSSIDTISSDTTTYSSSLVVLKESNIDTIKDLKDKSIGIYDNKESIEGYIIPQEIIKENKLNTTSEIVNYENIEDLVTALYEKEVDAIFITSNYHVLFSFNGFTNIKEETKVLISKDKTVKVTDNNRQDIKEPFTILLMGVDSTLDSIKSGSAFNGDALMLITFNPKTLNATMLSIPRDTYVPITCFKNQKENKITHAAWYGEKCMIETIENFTKIDIDYYAKINFKGLVKLVDNLGGVYVDVPYSLCEQDSNRLWGKNTIFLEKGYGKINGEQALALSRNRHKASDGTDIGRQMALYCPTYNEGRRDDIERGQNQQKVINGIINGIKDINRLDDIYNILDLMGDSVETNMNTNQILSLYNIIKNMLLNDSASTLSFDSLYLKGSDTLIWDDSFKKQLYNYYYNRQSLADVTKAMNINLEKEKPTLIKEIYFSINDLYEKPMIGRGPYKYESTINLVPNFNKKEIDYATNWGKANSVKVIIEYIDVNTVIDNNKIVKQSIPYGYIVENINKDLIISVGKYTQKELEEQVDTIPDFSNYSIDEVTSWKNSVSTKLNVTITEVKKDDPTYDLTMSGKFKSQSVPAGTIIDEIDNITIIFYEKS